MADNAKPAGVRAAVERLRGQVRLWLLAGGLARVLPLALGLALLSLLVDRLLHMDGSQRTLSLLLGLGVVGYGVWRWLWRPLAARLDEVSLALRLEAANPALRGRLAAALELAEGSPGEASASLEQLSVAQAEAAVGRQPLQLGLNHSSLRRHMWLLVGLLAVVLAAVAVAPQALGIWFERNVLLGDTQWPRRVTLVVEDVVDGSLRVPTGGALLVSVRAATASGALPESLSLEIVGRRGERRTEVMSPVTAGRYQLRMPKVMSPFRFQVSGGDGITPWIDVVLLPRPKLSELQATVTPPAYTGESARTAPVAGGTLEVLAGAELALTGRSNHVLQRVTLRRDGKLLAAATSPEPRAFAFRFAPAAVPEGRLRLQLEDELGVRMAEARRLLVRRVPDEPPDARLRVEGLGALIVPRARLPLVGSASDDFGVAALQLDWHVQHPDGTEDGPERQLLWEGEPQAERRVQTTREAAVYGVAPDDLLSLRLVAYDANDVSGPGETVSGQVSLRVVTESELREHLLNRERSLAQRFERVVKASERLLDDARVQAAAEAGSEAAPGMTRRQRQVRLWTDDLAAGFEKLLAEATNNRLVASDPEYGERLERGIVRPMRREVLPLMDAAAVQLHEFGSAGDSDWNTVVTRQQRILEALRGIQERLAAPEELQQLIRRLREVLREQERVREQTEKRREEATEGLFE